jgi:two-component system CheB/CheR fusion protein
MLKSQRSKQGAPSRAIGAPAQIATQIPSTNARQSSSGAHAVDTTSSSSTPIPFPIVGIGASVGGLSAFYAFYSGMPADREPRTSLQVAVLIHH